MSPTRPNPGPSISSAETFHAKLGFVLKRLSISRGKLAAELEVDKSVVGRWVTGAARPSAHNLSRLSAYIARRVDNFTTLDWERPIRGLAVFMGADPDSAPGGAETPGGALPLALMDQSRSTIARRAGAYEGFFRTTRPYAQSPGRFMHDTVMIRRDAGGDLRFEMVNDGVKVDGLILLLQNQLFVVSAELTSGAFAFAILNGVSTVQAGMLDGLMLWCSLDPGRTPTASAILLERTGDLSGDQAADNARFAELARAHPLAPEGSVPSHIVKHLTPELGPSQIARGGDLLLSLPLSRSLSRGLGVPR